MAFEKFKSEQGIHLDDFIHLYNEAPFELIDGERIPIVPGLASHITTIRAIMRILDAYIVQHQLGQVFSEAPFILEDKPDWVKGSRVPDVLFFNAERFNQYIQSTPEWQSRPFILVPDLAVEVVSPNDKFSDVTKKAEQYLKDGVQLVWIVDPQQKQVIVYQQGQNILQKLEKDDLVSGYSVIPDFEAKVSQFFDLD
ncbi:MAG: hypothetical protein Phog2KO_39170 [Phototrophicaceae bacterium]